MFGLFLVNGEMWQKRYPTSAFEAGAGIEITTWRYEGDETIEERGRASAAAFGGEQKVSELQGRAKRIVEQAEQLRKAAKEIAA